MLNIFDRNDISDLPLNLREKASLSFRSKFTNDVFELFKIKNTLHVDDIIVAYYRKHGYILDRKKAQSIVNNLRVQKVLKRVDVNTYQLIREI
jgi:hypothetical protein